MDPVIQGLSPEDRARIESQLQKHWTLPGDHPLNALHGVQLGPYRLTVLLGPKSAVGSPSFQLLLSDAGGHLSDSPLALGLFNRGPYPAFNWIELTRYDPQLTLRGAAIDIRKEGLDLPLFEAISRLVPNGGHIMVEYDSPAQRPTERVLTLGYPEASSPTGYLLLQAGCRSYKNWHISEGGREGPRKLQGFKPWNDEIRREKTQKLREELSVLLARPPNPQHGEWGTLARQNAQRALDALDAESYPPSDRLYP